MPGSEPRVTVVTGAASGVGWATVAALRGPGSVIIGVDRADPPEPAEGLHWVCGDVTDDQTWSRVLDLAHPAGAHALIACAADIVVKPLLRTTMDDWRRIFDINVLGVVRGMQALLPGMITREAGAVAVVCSVDSFFVEEDMSVYCASKAALLQVVRSAALEHARHGVRINAACPGAVRTPLFDRAMAEAAAGPAAARAATERRIPTGSVLRPEEVAAVLRFLVSDAASGLSGAAITVDGGLTSTYDYAGLTLTADKS